MFTINFFANFFATNEFYFCGHLALQVHNVDLKFYKHFSRHIKIMDRRYHIIFTPEIYKMFVYKHTETIKYVNKNANFVGN